MWNCHIVPEGSRGGLVVRVSKYKAVDPGLILVEATFPGLQGSQFQAP